MFDPEFTVRAETCWLFILDRRCGPFAASPSAKVHGIAVGVLDEHGALVSKVRSKSLCDCCLV